MPEEPTTKIVSEDEIEAALAEAEATAAHIPSLDDGSGEVIVPVPVEAAPPKATPTWVRPAVDSPPPTESAEPPPSAASKGPAATKPATAPGEAPPAPGPPNRAVQLVCHTVDAVLWALNRPFGWVPLAVRHIAGIVAIVTILISLLALVLLPRLFPPNDLHAQLSRAVVDARVGAAPTPAAPAAKH